MHKAVTHLSIANMSVLINSVVLVLLCKKRKMAKGARMPYRTAKRTDGAKSTGSGVPPTGVGKVILKARNTCFLIPHSQ